MSDLSCVGVALLAEDWLDQFIAQISHHDYMMTSPRLKWCHPSHLVIWRTRYGCEPPLNGWIEIARIILDWKSNNGIRIVLPMREVTHHTKVVATTTTRQDSKKMFSYFSVSKKPP